MSFPDYRDNVALIREVLSTIELIGGRFLEKRALIQRSLPLNLLRSSAFLARSTLLKYLAVVVIFLCLTSFGTVARSITALALVIKVFLNVLIVYPLPVSSKSVKYLLNALHLSLSSVYSNNLPFFYLLFSPEISS